MCNFTGTIYMILGSILLLKYVSRKFQIKRMNLFLGKWHKKTSILFLIVSVVHTITSIPLFSQNSFFTLLWGWIGLIAGFVLVVSGFFIGKHKKALTWHRWAAIIYTISTFLHMFR